MDDVPPPREEMGDSDSDDDAWPYGNDRRVYHERSRAKRKGVRVVYRPRAQRKDDLDLSDILVILKWAKRYYTYHNMRVADDSPSPCGDWCAFCNRSDRLVAMIKYIEDGKWRLSHAVARGHRRLTVDELHACARWWMQFVINVEHSNIERERAKINKCNGAIAKATEYQKKAMKIMKRLSSSR